MPRSGLRGGVAPVLEQAETAELVAQRVPRLKACCGTLREGGAWADALRLRASELDAGRSCHLAGELRGGHAGTVPPSGLPVVAVMALSAAIRIFHATRPCALCSARA
jgi:hypothetical protein